MQADKGQDFLRKGKDVTLSGFGELVDGKYHVLSIDSVEVERRGIFLEEEERIIGFTIAVSLQRIKEQKVEAKKV